MNLGEIFCKLTPASGYPESAKEKLSRLERILREGRDRIIPVEQARIQLVIDELARKVAAKMAMQ